MKELITLDFDLGKYIQSPNVDFHGGLRYDGKDLKLCDDIEDNDEYYIRVTQEIKDNVLITDLIKNYKRGEKSVKEESHLEAEIEVGELLVYVVGKGFVITNSPLCTIDEAIEMLEILRGDRNDTSGDTEAVPSAD